MAGKIFMRIIAFFMVIGGMDRITGDHLGLGREFEKGFRMLGELALCMTGILCLTPAAVELLKPWIVRTGSYLDPSFFLSFCRRTWADLPWRRESHRQKKREC